MVKGKSLIKRSCVECHRESALTQICGDRVLCYMDHWCGLPAWSLFGYRTYFGHGHG